MYRRFHSPQNRLILSLNMVSMSHWCSRSSKISLETQQHYYGLSVATFEKCWAHLNGRQRLNTIQSHSYHDWTVRNPSERLHKPPDTRTVLDEADECCRIVWNTAEYIISIRYRLKQTHPSMFRITSNDISLPRLHRNSSRLSQNIHSSKLQGLNTDHQMDGHEA